MRPPSFRHLFVLVATLVLVAPSFVRAQEPPQTAGAEAPPPPRHPGGRGDVSLTFALGHAAPGADSLDGATAILRAQARVTGPLLAGAALGLAYATYSPDRSDSRSAVAAANPYVYAQVAFASGALGYRVGLGLSFPLASEDSDAVVAPETLALAAHGSYDAWLWLPRRFGVVLPAELVFQLASNLWVGSEAALAYLVYTGDSGAGNKVTFQLAPWMAYTMGALRVGARVQAVFYDFGIDDKLAWGLGPFGQYTMDRWFFRAMLLLNVDRPWGFGDSGYGAFSLQLGAGATF